MLTWIQDSTLFIGVDAQRNFLFYQKGFSIVIVSQGDVFVFDFSGVFNDTACSTTNIDHVVKVSFIR